MNNLRFSLGIITLLFAFMSMSSVQAQISSDEIDVLVENAMTKFNVAGMAIGVVKDGKVIHSKGYGVQSIKTKKKVNKHTNFIIASNSKAFTSAALAILVDEGKISWQDKVKDYIPNFKMYNCYVTENFNIEDLLTHRSGLGLGAGDLTFFPDSSDFTIDDVVSCFQYFKPKSAFRTKFAYDNLLYTVAGEVIARVSGMTWEEFVEKRIMQPLNMDNTYGSLSRVKDKENIATAHSTSSGEIRTLAPPSKDEINGAAGGIVSNVDDLCKWLLAQLNKGKYGNNLENELFSEARQNEMWKIYTTLPIDPNPRYNTHFAGYGLGWFLKDVKGNINISHTGAMPGMLSSIDLFPDLGLGIVILTNTEEGGWAAFRAVSKSISDSFLGLNKFDWIEYYSKLLKNLEEEDNQVSKKVWETVKLANSDHSKFEDYIGVYEDNWFGKIEVFEKDKQLWFKSYRSPKLNGPMYYYKANTFAIKWEDQTMKGNAFAMFNMDEEGKAQSIKMKGISPNIDFSFDFQDLDLERIESK